MGYDVRVSAYDPGQLAPLLALFGTYFPAGDRLLSRDYTDWLYGRNPFGRAWMAYVLDGDQWVAFVAFVPIAFERAGSRLDAYYAVNGLVDPRHQGHSLFARMITAGRERLAEEKRPFMGHPNSLAMKTWQRAQVPFQEALVPALALPLPRSRGWTARRAQHGRDLEKLNNMLVGQASARDHWKVAASSEYLQWRFLDQPGNPYTVQVLEKDGTPAGVQIARRMRPGVHLMIDQFVRDDHIPAATRLLPPLTVCFAPERRFTGEGSALLRLPWKKRLPWFFTGDPPVSPADVRHINLTASDF